jgi:hypothetical protein
VDLDLNELHALRVAVVEQIKSVQAEVRLKAERLEAYTDMAIEVGNVRRRWHEPL